MPDYTPETMRELIANGAEPYDELHAHADAWDDAERAHEETKRRLEEALSLLRENDGATFGNDSVTGEAVEPWVAEDKYQWEMKARALVQTEYKRGMFLSPLI